MANLFKQIPIYDSSERFEINATELSMMVKMAEVTQQYMPIFENMISRLIDQNKITIRYEDSKGNELTEEDIAKILKSASDQIHNDSSIEPDL